MTRVLIAEDNEDIQNLLKVYIKRAGAEVQIANNGQEVIDMAFSDTYDLVFLDIEMPILNGVETAKSLKENGFYQPLYAFTANDEQDDIAQYLASGFVGYLKKPVDPKKLEEILQLYNGEQNDDTIPPIMLEDNPLRGDEDIAPLIDQFLNRLPSTLSKMDYALQRLDWESLASYAHQIKGSAGGFGYPKLTELSSSLEKAIKSNELHRTQALYSEIKVYVLG